MGHENYIRGSVIHNRSGAIVHVGKSEDQSENKYYAVVVKCGHVGRGYFIPICLTFCAKDMESAIELAKNTSRVKRYDKFCILAVSEVSQTESLLIEYANEHDPYLRTDFYDETYDTIISRRVIEESKTKELEDIEELIVEDENIGEEISIVPSVKTADMYEDYQILQRAFAPMKYGERYIHPKKVDMKSLLSAYYEELAIKYGILDNKASPISYYYQIFGEGNSLGVTYDEESGCLKYTSLRGKEVYVPLSDSSRQHVIDFIESREEIVLPPEDNFDSVPYVSDGRAVEKFNRRLERTRKLQEKKPAQPGDN